MTDPLSIIRPKQAAPMLGGVTPATLRRWHKKDILKMKKLSPRVMGYTREQLEAFIQGRKAQEGDK